MDLRCDGGGAYSLSEQLSEHFRCVPHGLDSGRTVDLLGLEKDSSDKAWNALRCHPHGSA
jgi:hypothetical protein